MTSAISTLPPGAGRAPGVANRPRAISPTVGCRGPDATPGRGATGTEAESENLNSRDNS